MDRLNFVLVTVAIVAYAIYTEFDIFLVELVPQLRYVMMATRAAASSVVKLVNYEYSDHFQQVLDIFQKVLDIFRAGISSLSSGYEFAKFVNDYFPVIRGFLKLIKEALSFVHTWVARFSNDSVAKVVVALLGGIGFSYLSSIFGLFYVVVTIAIKVVVSIVWVIWKIVKFGSTMLGC